MREYKIFKTDLGYGIYRKKMVGKIMLLQYLDGNNSRGTNKSYARTFYTEESAISALVTVRIRGDKEPPKPEEDAEKQSWSELS